jgi:hypothetical protein
MLPRAEQISSENARKSKQNSGWRLTGRSFVEEEPRK